jgi:hypothetical protein
VNFIKSSLDKGMSKNEIEDALIQKGWNGLQISEAFSEASNVSKDSNIKMSSSSSNNRVIYIVLGVMMLLFVAVGAGLFLWPSAECSSDRDCGSGYSCSSGECIVAVSEDECSKDSDCSSGYECSSGECVRVVVEEEEEPECYFDKDCSTGYECNDNVCEKIVSTTPSTIGNRSNATNAYPNYFINSIVVKSINSTSLSYDVNISNDEATSTSVEDTLNCSVTNNRSSSIYSGVKKDSGPESVDSSVRTCSVAINYSELYQSLNFKSPMRLAVNATVDYFNNVTETDERDNSKVGFFDLYKENFTTLPTVSCSSDAGCVSFFGPRYVCSSGVCVAGSASLSSTYPNYLINSVFFENITQDTLNLRVNVTNRNDVDSSVAQFLLCEATNNVTRSVYNGTVRHDSPEGLGSEVVICNVSINGTDLYSRLLLKKVMRLGVNVTADYYNNIIESNETDNYKPFVMNLFAENFTFTTLPTISCIDDTGCRRMLGIGYECSSGVCVAASSGAEEVCDDLIDNDKNGKVDYTGGCDVDGDLKVDYILGCLPSDIQPEGAWLESFISFNDPDGTGVCGWYEMQDDSEVEGYYDDPDLACGDEEDIEGVFFYPEDTSVCSKPSLRCNDGVDNDGDDLIDYGTGASNDPGCANSNDNFECVNSDCDAYVCDTTNDACYSTCSTGDECASGYECSSGVCVEAASTAECNDGVDNDGNGDIDYYGVCEDYSSGFVEYIACNEIDAVAALITDLEELGDYCEENCHETYFSNDAGCSDISDDSEDTEEEGLCWNIQTVDDVDDVGAYNSLAFDSNDNPRISYYDSTHGDLKYARLNSGTWTIVDVDADDSLATNVGAYNSLAFDSNDNPRISYYDSTHGDLKYARLNSGTWTIVDVDADDDITTNVGMYSSLVFDSNGNPGISYYDSTHGDLKYARLNSGAWSIVDVYDEIDADLWSEDNVGQDSSLAFDDEDKPWISHFDQTNLRLKLAYMDGDDWIDGTVGDGYAAHGGSLAFDSNGNPGISFMSYSSPYSIMYAYLGDSGWEVETIESPVSSGLTSLAFDSNGNPGIAYSIDGNTLRYTYYCDSDDCDGEWITKTFTELSDLNYPSLAFDSNGNPGISYYDATNGVLKYATTNCGNYACGSDNLCLTSCADDAQCASGYECNDLGFCRLSEADTSECLADCGAYVCDTTNDVCYDSCKDDSYCAVGYVCGPMGKCRLPLQAAAELEESWFMKIIMFFIKSEPVLEKFKNLGSILL